MNVSVYVSILALVVSGLMLLFAILTFARNGAKDNKEEERKEEAKIDGIKQSLLKVDFKLDQVFNTSNETRNDLKALGQSINDMDRRLTIVERDMKTAFKQIDEVKKVGERHD